MTQREMIRNYNDKFRPKFNKDLFVRSDEDLIEMIRKVIYSCERDSIFTIKVLEFSVIDNYDDINHILWEYEDSIINRVKKAEEEGKPSKSKKTTKKKDNQFGFINLKDSDIKLIKITYYIRITEKKNGLVDDTVTVYIAIPRVVKGFYFRINGNMYSAMYQIVDGSTYNNSSAKKSKKHTVTFKTIFGPINVYRHEGKLETIDGEQIPCIYFIGYIFMKTIMLMKYFLAKMGLYGAMNFLKIQYVSILDNIENIDKEENYIFPIREENPIYIVVPRFIFDSIQIVQSFVYTIHSILVYMKDIPYTKVFENETWMRALESDFTKEFNMSNNKGISILDSLTFIYDQITREDLRLPEEDKTDIYKILRWMMYEFNALRRKDNVDVTTKKIRYAEYCASLYAIRLANGIKRISQKGDDADINTVKKAIKISPMYLIKQMISSKNQLINYNNCVNDLDSIIALKCTYKGISGIGEKSQAISYAYRSVHPSHLGRIDIDSSSNSDPGVSGNICPFVQLDGNHFSVYEEPNTWKDDLAKVIDAYKQTTSKIEIARLVRDVGFKQPEVPQMTKECAVLMKRLLKFPEQHMETEEIINGYDVFGNGLFYVLYE